MLIFFTSDIVRSLNSDTVSYYCLILASKHTFCVWYDHRYLSNKKSFREGIARQSGFADRPRPVCTQWMYTATKRGRLLVGIFRSKIPVRKNVWCRSAFLEVILKFLEVCKLSPLFWMSIWKGTQILTCVHPPSANRPNQWRGAINKDFSTKI